MTKLDAYGDPHLAPFGRVLRASGLDELPQIFNVLHGEMSLVGPRPCTPNEFDHYEPWQRQRANCLPGLTGYWQVNGKNKTTFSEMIAMDLFLSQEPVDLARPKNHRQNRHRYRRATLQCSMHRNATGRRTKALAYGRRFYKPWRNQLEKYEEANHSRRSRVRLLGTASGSQL